ncbi:hypothetical protein [Teredinibacter purpureus]|uniref:hypothetical protein n=1 Tax=Teredinibacter purpureus TaxID=2731756 RepID=UPI0013C4679C|nr:hypothetical protein [Teredinibacter purpureus]
MNFKANCLNFALAAFVVFSIVTAMSLLRSPPSKQCEAIEGHIFIDCIDPSWHGISSWEMRYDDGAESLNTREGGDLVKWQIIDAKEHARQQILDVHFTRVPANGRLRFHAKGGGQPHDMTAFAGGTLQFDVRVHNWGLSERILVAQVVCGFPCGSGPHRIEVPRLNEWTSIVLLIDELVAGGLDLARVDIGLAISPTWNRMQGIHFQLDNIRWVKPITDE